VCGSSTVWHLAPTSKSFIRPFLFHPGRLNLKLFGQPAVLNAESRKLSVFQPAHGLYMHLL